MKFILSAVEPELFNAFRTVASALHDVDAIQGSILDIDCDAIVSPANSFGFMDGGIDAVYMRHFGSSIQTKVRERILYDFAGELLVGQATIVETGQERPKYLIAAPTMRIPQILGSETVNPYLATRATIILANSGVLPTNLEQQGRPIRDVVQSIAIPGLGTGIGRVPAQICAHQIKQAIVDFRDGAFRLPQSWSDASVQHQELYQSKPRNLQY
ncbi:MAG: macro domain-containing protein [Pseudomonadota bacterium]